METENQCRFCLQDENEEQFIVPCKCSGSAQYIHRSCLDTWRASDVTGVKFRTCPVCHFDYVIDADESLSDKNKSKKYIFQTTVDLLFWLFISIICIVLGVIALRFLDPWRIIPHLFFFGWDELSYSFAVIIIYGLVWCLLNKDYNQLYVNGLTFGSVTGIMVTGLSYAIVKSHQNIMKTMDDNHKRIFLKEQTGLYRVRDFRNCPPEELPWHDELRRNPIEVA